MISRLNDQLYLPNDFRLLPSTLEFVMQNTETCKYNRNQNEVLLNNHSVRKQANRRRKCSPILNLGETQLDGMKGVSVTQNILRKIC